ncbi:MAG: galactose-1-phosphate uridylyltransferase [Firmicutes bacterium]|nr:galactose-1-phosphate uridylyltransferase [Bacillota bacterium]MDH7495824.1 galactose-1-phosphate uridylyltransferase [Bacillota bacterium]
MPELRLDPVTGRWVLVATERAKRPKDFVHGDPTTVKVRPERSDACPFCPGNEAQTPPEIFSFRQDGTQPDHAGWWVRGVPNKYPALTWKPTVQPSTSGVFAVKPATGAHEVIIESPIHNASPATMSYDQMAEVVRAYRHRYKSLAEEPEIKYILVFRNHGRDAGASLEHPHSQIAAVPLVPPVVLEELAGARHHYESTGRCVFCDIVSQELEAGARVVAETSAFIALEPYASKMPFETWVLPKAHSPSFEDLDPSRYRELGGVLVDVLGALGAGLDDPPYNYILHTAPPHERCEGYYHWHIEIFPKLTVAAGFEFGMGVYINVTTPESAAEFLRNHVSGLRSGRNSGVQG